MFRTFSHWLAKAIAQTRRPDRSNGRSTFHPQVEVLEDRLAPATLTVTSDADSGPGTLRAAISAANTSGDIIQFNSTLTGPTGNTIDLNSSGGPLLLTKNITIQGPTSGNISVSGQNAVNVFAIQGGSNATVAIKNLSILNGKTITSGSFNFPKGGGIFVGSGDSLTLGNVTISNSVSGTSGGGIFFNGNSLTIDNSTITTNSATKGGGIYLSAGNVTISNSTIGAANSATTGGGIYILSGTLKLSNSTVANNSATGNGGGIANTPSGASNLTLGNDTIFNNSAGTSGGGIYNNGGGGTTLIIYDTTLAGDSAPTAGPDLKGAVTTDSGNNLVGNTTGSSGFTGPGDLLNKSPTLGPLQLNGGPTATLDELPGSLSIAAGRTTTPPSGYTLPVTDQRGFPRTVGGQIDIGAFQVQGRNVGAVNLSGDTWYLSSGSGTTTAVTYGAPGWYPVPGDWYGDGVTRLGVVDTTGTEASFPGSDVWYIPNQNGGGNTVFAYGAHGWVPVAGDWTGTGHFGIGVFDPATATWYLRSEVSAGGPDAATPFQYGNGTWTPVVGDWNGQGKDTIGMVDRSTETWYLRNSNSSGAPDITPFAYGAPNWFPVAGNWNANAAGQSGIGVVDVTGQTNGNDVWYLRNEVSAGSPDFATPFAYGAAGWFPVAGNWSTTLPQLAAGGEAAVPSGAAALTEAQLQSEVQTAFNLLSSDGVNHALLTRLASLQFTVGQLPDGYLGLSNLAAGTVDISPDAAGYGWFVDANPLHDSVPANRMDLLTVVLHEMGHFDGWTELDPATHPDALMALTLGTGQRRIQDIDAVFAAGL